MSAIAMLAFAMTSAGAFAQQKSLKDQIVGTWSISAVTDQYEDGKKENPWGAGVKGVFNFDGNGHYTWIIFGEKQAAMKTDDVRRPDRLLVVQIGAYAVDGNSIKTHVDNSANSIRDGADQTFTVTGSGDALTLAGSARKDQKGTFTPTLEVVRAK
jgi:hypothetical protein